MRTCPSCGRENPAEALFCMACATPLEPVPAPRETRKTVTIVFCDVTGSTALGEKLDPESLRRVMLRYFEEMRVVLERHGGTVEKFIGDAVMAVFGIPQVHEDDALRAVRAADEMRERLVSLNEELERDRGVAIATRIGVNTGEVVAGDPSAGQTLVTGDAVNLAARLEQAAGVGEVLIGADTYGLVRDAVEVESVPPLEAKGKAEPVTAYRLLRVIPGATGHVRRMDSPMVGREREAALLRQAFDRAVSDRACQLFTILGPAGLGKTRLLQEVVGGLEGVTVLSGRCLSYGQGITYFPVVEVVREAAGLADFDTPEVVESKICQILLDEEHGDVVCVRIAQLMGIGDLAVPEETFWAIRRMFEALARRSPLVLAFDDVHWAEPTLLDLVEHIADWSRDAPILLVCMARPELLDQRPTWGGGKLNAATISLEPLSDAQCGELVDNLLGRTELPSAFRDRVIGAAEGNPLFVHEVLGMLIDEGALVRTDGSWSAAHDLAEVAVPPTIAALIAARLDGLTAPERQVLEAAAVVGMEFYLGAVGSLLPNLAAQDRSGGLMGLVRKELVRPARSTLSGEDAFRFRNLLVHDATYASMPKELRADLHERFAGWLERVAGEQVGEREEILGYHLEQACRLRSELGPADERTEALARAAAARLGSAGERALDRGDGNAASNLLGRSVALLPRLDPERRRLFPCLLSAAGEDFERYEALCDEAIEIGRETGDRILEQWGLLSRSVYLFLGEPGAITISELSSIAADSVRTFEELHDDPGLAAALIEQINVLWSQGKVRAMLDAAERVLEVAMRGRPAVLDAAIHNLAAAMQEGPTPASQALARARELVDRCADRPLARTQAEMWSSMFLALLDRRDEATGILARCRQAVSDLGSPWYDTWCEGVGFFHAWWAGDLEAADECSETVLEGWRRMGWVSNVAVYEAFVAHVRYELGRIDGCLRAAEEAEALAGPWDLTVQVPARAARAKVLALRGALGEAEALVVDAERTIRATELFTETADLLMAKAEVLRLAGRATDAAASATEALGMYEAKEYVPLVAKARAFLEQLPV